MSSIHYSEDLACILSALAMATRIPTIAPDTREARLYRAGFNAGLQMVAEALGIPFPVAVHNVSKAIPAEICESPYDARVSHISS